ncbi:MAG: hypothetical protein K5924_02305 [Chloroflexi bacterium]|nr:hypothetical protein [Chloroflexota bacterium]
MAAAEPDASHFIAAAEDAGLPCEVAGDNYWVCEGPPTAHEGYFATISDERPLNFSVDVHRYWNEPRAAEPDVVALMDRFIVLALGEDGAARQWLRDVHAAQEATATLERGQWTLTWYADQEASPDNAFPKNFLVLNYNEQPSDEQPSSSAVPMPTAIAPPDDWSTGGRSTYSGVWTKTAVSIDGELLPDAEAVGESAPGELVVDCRGEVGRCDVGPTPDGIFDAEVLGEGTLTGTQETETSISMEACPVDTAVRTTELDVAYDAAGATITVDERTTPGRCEVDGASWAALDATWVFEGVLTAYQGPEVDVEVGGSEPPSAQDPDAAPVGNVGEPAARPFADAVPAVSEISTDPIVLLQSALLAALLVFLMPFPSQLFNSTLETHEDEVRRWFRLDRLGVVAGGIGAFWASWPGVAIFTLLAALLYGFLDPGFGMGLGSLATFVGMLLGIVLVTAAFSVPVVLAHRRIGSGWTLKVVPLSLLIGVACVLLSRLTGFQPGYLYGLLIGLAFARELSAAEEGRATAIGAVAMLGVALVSWLALGALPDGDGFGLVVARTSLAALMVAGLEGVVFGLLPMRFLPGESLYAWNRIAWGVLLALGAFAFFHILINPASGYLSDTSRTPLFTVLGLLLGFSLVSVAFWAWFRFRGEQRDAQA